MLKIASAHLWVHDQEVALKYWTEKVGMEVRQDVRLPELGFRWLTVGPPGQDDVSIVLMAVPIAASKPAAFALLVSELSNVGEMSSACAPPPDTAAAKTPIATARAKSKIWPIGVTIR